MTDEKSVVVNSNSDYVQSILLNLFQVHVGERAGKRYYRFWAWHVYSVHNRDATAEPRGNAVEAQGFFTQNAWELLAPYHDILLRRGENKKTRLLMVVKNAILKEPSAYISEAGGGTKAVPVERYVVHRPTKLRVAGRTEWIELEPAVEHARLKSHIASASQRLM